MLLLSTLVIAPVSLTASAAGQYGITINHIFNDGPEAANSYDELYGSFDAGETPVVTINAPNGYVIDSVYFTTAAGTDFVQYVENLQYDNPVKGVYHITMPAYDLTMNVIYRCILNSAIVEHVYDGGHYDDQDYDVDLGDNLCEGDTVIFSSDVKQGYTLSEIYVMGYTGSSFITILDNVAITDYGTGTYSIEMPDSPVIIVFVYTSNRHSITPLALLDGQDGVGADYYDGPATADPGETVVFHVADVADYSEPEVFVTAQAGVDFVEVLPLEGEEGTYYFVMPNAEVTVHMLYTNTRFNITVENVFEDGTVDDTVYYVGDATACEGQRVYFTVDAPDGYAVSEIYGTFAAGASFVEVFPVDSIAGAYYFDMPEGPVTLSIVYADTLFDIVAENVFEDGTVDNTAYYSGAAEAYVGDRVYFTVNAPEGYAVKEVFGTFTAGTSFVEVVQVDSLAGAYYFDMPEGPVTLSIVFTSTLFDVNFVSYMGTAVDQEWKEEDVAAGSDYIFSVQAPDGCAIDEVFAMSNLGGTFVELIPVRDLGNGVFSFEMPAADVDVVIMYKSTLFDVNYTSYDGDAVVNEWTDTGIEAGDKHIFTVAAPDGYVVEDVIATTAVNGLFIEILNVENLAGAYYFVMPEADVDVTVVLKKVIFNVTVNDVFDGQIVEIADGVAYANELNLFVVENPTGYETGYDYYSITVQSASDPSVIYDYTHVSGDVFSMMMPEDDVVITVQWKSILHSVTVSSVDQYGNLIEEFSLDDVPEGETVITPIALSAVNEEDYEYVEYFAVVEVAPFHEMLTVDDVAGKTIVFDMPDGNVNITLVWQKVAFTVTEQYIENETEVIDSLTSVWDVKGGDNWISIATVPEGYEISEVYVTAIDGVFAEFVDYIYLNDTTIYFEIPYGDVFVDYYLEKIVNTVNYYAYVDGELTLVKAEEVVYGEKAAWGADNAADDLPDGHAFIAWYLGGEAYDFDSEVKGDLNLIAVYEFVNYNVTFNTDGGSEVPAQVVIKNGKAVKPAAPEKEGYDFAGWKLNDAEYDFDTAVTADIELTASWTEKTYTVNVPTGEGYEVKIADGSDTTVKYGDSFSFTVEYDENVNTDDAVVSANGVALVADDQGVYTVEDIKSDVYISISGVGMTKLFTVKFNYYEGDEAISATFTVEAGKAAVAPVDTARYGYKFLGWFDNAEGTGEAVTDFTNVNADAEYFAVYEQNPLADYTFGDKTVTDSAYGIGFKEVKIEVVKNDAEYLDRDVYVIAAAQLKDGSTVLFYVPVYVEKGEAKADVSLILNSNTFVYVDMYLVYDEVDLSGSLNYIDIEAGIQIA